MKTLFIIAISFGACFLASFACAMLAHLVAPMPKHTPDNFWLGFPFGIAGIGFGFYLAWMVGPHLKG
jgi:dipeptide/tripeptide permease